MRRITLIGLCFATVLVFAALDAGASAAAPEFRHCVKIVGASEYESRQQCEKLSGLPHTDGWSLGPWKSGEPNNEFGGEGFSAVFKEQGSLGLKVECETNSSVGEITGVTTVSKITVTYKKCKGPGGVACKSLSPAGGAGEIITKPLVGSLVYLKSSAKEPFGILLEPASAGPFAEAECPPVKLEVGGSVIAEIPASFTGAGRMVGAIELIFSENVAKTAQLWNKVEEAGLAHELMDGTIRMTLVSTEKVEFDEFSEIV